MTTTTQPALIDGSDFEARKIDGLKFYVSKTEYIMGDRSDWALWDKTAEAWVTMGASVDAGGRKFIGPYLPRGGRRACKELVASGLYEGYGAVKAGALLQSA
jgi:hypothetical protein